MKAVFNAWWHLLRMGNLLTMTATLWLLWWVTDQPIPALWCAYLALGSVAIAGAGNVVNDLFDQRMDALNKPTRLWVGRVIPAWAAWLVYGLLQGIGLVCGLVLGEPLILAAFLGAAVALYTYSRYWKCRPWVGNLVVAGLCALFVLQYWLLCYDHLSTKWHAPLWIYAYLAFGSNWLREWVKDLEDREGDRQAGCQTLAVRWTPEQSHYGLFYLWMAFASALLLMLYLEGWLGYTKLIHACGGLLVLYTLAIGRSIFELHDEEGATALSKELKEYMIVGVLCLLVL